jgi:hypothetical protein
MLSKETDSEEGFDSEDENVEKMGSSTDRNVHGEGVVKNSKECG